MFITFEGIDSCGKSTQSKLLKDYYESQGKKVILTKNPGGTKIGQIIREEILLNNKTKNLSDHAELLLFMADRLQWIHEILNPALKEGKIVICDRYMESSIAYQRGGRKMNIKFIDSIMHLIPKPDRIFYLRIMYSESVNRLKQLPIENDRMENEKQEFFTNVIAEYDQLSIENDRIIMVDGHLSIEKIQAFIKDFL